MKIEDRKRMIMIIISIVILVLIGFIVFSGINNNNTHNGLIKSVKEFADKKRIDYSNKNVNATLDYGTVNNIPFKIVFKSENNEQFIDVVINDQKYPYFSGIVEDFNAIKEFIENSYVDSYADKVIIYNNSSTYNIQNGNVFHASIYMYNSDGFFKEIDNVITDYYVDGKENKCNVEVQDGKLKYCQLASVKEAGELAKVEYIDYDESEPFVISSFDAEVEPKPEEGVIEVQEEPVVEETQPTESENLEE